MTALALILRDLGKTVTGSDVSENFQTDVVLDRTGIKVTSGFDEKNLDSAEVVVYSASHQGVKNAQVQAALKKGLLVCALPEVVGRLTGLKKNIAICGCHGKSTTSALMSYIALRLNLKPSFFVGVSSFMEFPGGHWDKGDFFITEADEYLTDPLEKRISKFLYFEPQYIIATNLDFDHPDFFPNFEAVEMAFLDFFKRLKKGGFLVINGDDERLIKVAQKSQKPMLTYGFLKRNDYQIVEVGGGFIVKHAGKTIIKVKPSLLGQHNERNITAAIAFFASLKYDLKRVSQASSEFKGAKRRLELVANVRDSLIFDDYGHHPTEIKASLEALRARYPGYKLALCFQPHTFTRTEALLAEFVQVLSSVDYLGLLTIFPSAREKFNPHLNSELILNKLEPGIKKQLLLSEADWARLVENTQNESGKWIYLTMGAGDVYKKAELLVNYLQ